LANADFQSIFDPAIAGSLRPWRHRHVSGASSGFIVTMPRRQQLRSNTIRADHAVDLARSADVLKSMSLNIGAQRVVPSRRRKRTMVPQRWAAARPLDNR
jgi:hypothetical protein